MEVRERRRSRKSERTKERKSERENPEIIVNISGPPTAVMPPCKAEGAGCKHTHECEC